MIHTERGDNAQIQSIYTLTSLDGIMFTAKQKTLFRNKTRQRRKIYLSDVMMLSHDELLTESWLKQFEISRLISKD
jgi:hypothetical protein